MPEIPGYVLVHRARVWRTVRDGEKDAQGERAAEPTPGPWFAARRMSPRSSTSEADPGGRRREEAAWRLLYGVEYEDGSELTDPPKGSDTVEVEVRGAPIIYTVLDRPNALDTGEDVIGGQVDLAEVGDSA